MLQMQVATMCKPCKGTKLQLCSVCQGDKHAPSISFTTSDAQPCGDLPYQKYHRLALMRLPRIPSISWPPDCCYPSPGKHFLEWSPFQGGVADMLVLCPLCGSYGEQKCFSCMGEFLLDAYTSEFDIHVIAVHQAMCKSNYKQ